jgi:hypothetical protein
LQRPWFSAERELLASPGPLPAELVAPLLHVLNRVNDAFARPEDWASTLRAKNEFVLLATRAAAPGGDEHVVAFISWYALWFRSAAVRAASRAAPSLRRSYTPSVPSPLAASSAPRAASHSSAVTTSSCLAKVATGRSRIISTVGGYHGKTLGALATTDTALDWVVPIAALAAVVFFVLCLLAHPEKAALVRTLGIGLVVLAALTVLFGWVIPSFVPALLTDSPWAEIPAGLADGSRTLILGTALLLTGAGIACLAAAGRMGRSRRWSTPVSTYRYRDERSWS